MDDLKARLQAEADSFRAASVKVEGDSHAADLLTEALSRITELEEKQGLTESQGMADRESTGWRTIDSAPRDGTYILALVGNAPEHWGHLGGRAFVIRHEGATPSGFDLGWALHPGFGGVSDEWFTHWQPLPAAPVLPRIARPQDDQTSSSLDAGRSGGGAS